MGQLVKLNGYVANFVETGGNAYYTAEGDKFYNIPHWFKKTDVTGVYELFRFEELPKEMQKILTDGYPEGVMLINSETKEIVSGKDMLNYPHKQLGLDFEEGDHE
jgi:hypothetical protein